MRESLAGLLVAMPLVLVITAACGGGDNELTLEEYLWRLDSLEADGERELNEATDKFEEALETAETEAQQVEAYREYVRDLFSSLPEDFDAYTSLDPPSEVEDLHNDLVAAQADGLELFEDIDSRAQLAESAADVEDLSEEVLGPEMVEVTDRAQEAFCAIQEIADDRGIDVDVGCEN